MKYILLFAFAIATTPMIGQQAIDRWLDDLAISNRIDELLNAASIEIGQINFEEALFFTGEVINNSASASSDQLAKAHVLAFRALRMNDPDSALQQLIQAIAFIDQSTETDNPSLEREQIQNDLGKEVIQELFYLRKFEEIPRFLNPIVRRLNNHTTLEGASSFHPLELLLDEVAYQCLQYGGNMEVESILHDQIENSPVLSSVGKSNILELLSEYYLYTDYKKALELFTQAINLINPHNIEDLEAGRVLHNRKVVNELFRLKNFDEVRTVLQLLLERVQFIPRNDAMFSTHPLDQLLEDAAFAFLINGGSIEIEKLLVDQVENAKNIKSLTRRNIFQMLADYNLEVHPRKALEYYDRAMSYEEPANKEEYNRVSAVYNYNKYLALTRLDTITKSIEQVHYLQKSLDNYNLIKQLDYTDSMRISNIYYNLLIAHSLNDLDKVANIDQLYRFAENTINYNLDELHFSGTALSKSIHSYATMVRVLEFREKLPNGKRLCQDWI